MNENVLYIAISRQIGYENNEKGPILMNLFDVAAGLLSLFPDLAAKKHLPDSREGLPDSREGGHDIDLRYYHGHVMAMIVFMGMDIAMLFACYGHAISGIINMVMEMSWP